MKLKNWVGVVIVGITLTLATLTVSALAQQASPFSDIKGNTHEQAIKTLHKEQIVFGKTSKLYAPNDVATRGETAQMFANALQLDTSNVDNPHFPDVPTTYKYYGAIAALANAGIVSGNNGYFMPNGNFKRANAAKMITLGFDLKIATSISSKFIDMPRHYETALYVQTLINYDLTRGTTPTTFHPNSDLTRGHVATFLYNTIEALADDLTIANVK